MIGQDVCIFKQYLVVKKQWVLPDGTAAVNPKDEGIGIMLSSFCSRDFGYGFKLSPSQLVIVNNYRMGKKYKDEDAAMEILKQKDKNPITTSPFVRSFEYGANSEGFWTYHHIVLQFEDVVDVLKALYGDSYCFLFFFDHSSGHDKLRPNGLNYNGLNVKHGGGQHVMRNSKIESTAYLGSFEHPNKLQVGQVQSMQYQQDDTGSFYLNRAFRQELKYDQETDEDEMKKFTRAELIDKIRQKTNSQIVRGTLKEVQSLATKHEIPIEYQRKKVIEGWNLGKVDGSTRQKM